MVDELHDQVKNQLIRHIQDPITRKCKAFVTKGDDIGRGVTDRMHDLFGDLADEVTTAAAQPATKILTKLFADVAAEINVVAERWKDPLAAAADAIVSSQEDFLRRSDRQKRRRVLEAIRAALEACPPDLDPGEGTLDPAVHDGDHAVADSVAVTAAETRSASASRSEA